MHGRHSVPERTICACICACMRACVSTLSAKGLYVVVFLRVQVDEEQAPRVLGDLESLQVRPVVKVRVARRVACREILRKLRVVRRGTREEKVGNTGPQRRPLLLLLLLLLPGCSSSPCSC